jgi:hypothetical protein
VASELNPDETWTHNGGTSHTHRYQGQSLRHAHVHGGTFHGYFEHPEDWAVTSMEDVLRVDIAPGLTAYATSDGRTGIEADRWEHGNRYDITDVAVAVVGLETVRDVAGGPPAEGSPMQAAITGMLEVADALEEAARLDVRKQMLALLASTAMLRNLAADLRYGRLPQEWMERPVSNATMCPVCWMYARKLGDGSAVLRHRPACPGKDE